MKLKLRFTAVILFMAAAPPQVGAVTCLDTAGHNVTAEIRNADMLHTDKAAQAVLTASEGYRSPAVDACSVDRSGESNIVVQAGWNNGRLMVSSYDALSSFISFAYGEAGKSPIAEDFHLVVYVKAASEAAFHRLLDATLGKGISPAHSLQIRYMYEQFPNQQQDVLLVWNTGGKPGETQPPNVLGIRYQYDGVKVQP